MPRSAVKISSRDRIRPALETNNQSRSNSALVNSMPLSLSQASRKALSTTSGPNCRRRDFSVVGFGRVTASQQRLDPRQQQSRVHRFAHVIVGAEVEALDLVGVVGSCRKHQNRPVITVAHLAADAQAIFAGEHQVEDHQIRLLLDDPRRRQRTVAFDVHAQSIGFR